jgi:predicted DNA-binding transcriptional regulator AlpA
LLLLAAGAPMRSVTLANPHPDVAKLRARGNAPLGWISEHVDDWIRAQIKGVPYAPGPLPQFPTVIRKKELLRRVGLSYPTVWALMKKELFPKSFRLTDRAEAQDAAD